jgi:hypothetical protein
MAAPPEQAVSIMKAALIIIDLNVHNVNQKP